MSDTVALEAAAIDVRMARERLIATSRELQSRFDPATLIEDAREGVRGRISELVEATGETARRRPGVVAGIGAGLLLLAMRKPIRRLFRRRHETEKPHRR